jgi:multiple sugar transport system substrate-binding protein
MLFSVAYVMNHQTKHQAEAWELISYLTGKKGMLKWAKTGFALPTRKSVVKQLDYDRDPLRLPLIKGTDYAIAWQMGEYPSIVINSFENQFISVLLGEQPLKQAMLKAENSANQKISFME